MAEAHELINHASDAEAQTMLLRCCRSQRWAIGMLAKRPFASTAALLSEADRVWSTLARDDYLEAFAGHPEIGANEAELRQRFASTAAWSHGEQRGVAGASDAVLKALATANRAYRARFGYIFIVCASGKSAEEMLTLVERRLHHEPELELGVAAAEQAKITRLRLQKLAA